MLHCRRVQVLTLLAGLFLLIGCGGRGGDKQEDISALRSLGVSASPLVSVPSQPGQAAKMVELSFYAAVPKGVTASLTPFVDSAGSSGAIPIAPSDIQIEPGSEQYTEYSSFRLFAAKAQVKIPPATAFHSANFIGGQLRYGLTVTAGGDHENIIGNLLVVPDGAPQLAWQNPALTITAPLDGAAMAAASDIDLRAEVGNTNGEGVKIGWFVSNGSVSNRRAAATKWSVKEVGAQTIAVVIHGVQSRGFALRIINVTTD